MLNRTNLLIVGVAVLGAVLGLVAGTQLEHAPSRPVPAGMTVLKRGDRRADLKLEDPTGATRSLSEWDGKLVLLNFWATWCAPCREEMPLLDAKRGDLLSHGVEVIGIAFDDEDDVRDYLVKNPVKYPILFGDNADTLVLFGDERAVLPYSVLIGRDGKLLAQRAGSFSENELSSWLGPYLRD